MPSERLLGTLAAAAAILTIAVGVGGALASTPALASSLPQTVTAALVALLVVAVVLTGVTGAGGTDRTPYW
ncbi:hypothetical protein [Halobacterium rubrum]|uniref:hypothetical protein n=1 Tax=Halobacterium TaxID=2239 RepID=UPI001F38E63D|nr:MULTISPECIES: hypothetical protein [Halobacterium]MDH5019986.1 hypothetical protein [Halobacterium rubrum]